jgi:cytochrome c553
MKSVRWGLIALSAALVCSTAHAQTPAAAPAPAAAAEPAPIVGNAVDGKTKAYTCFGCHGIPNYNSVYPTYRVPKLGGQHPEYIVAALQEYKKGARPHPTMHAQASSMSDQDMADIAAYLSKAPELK